MANAKAMMTVVKDIGTYIDVGNVLKLDFTVCAHYVGDDGRVHTADVHAIVDPAGTINAMGVAFKDAIVAYGTTQGFTVTVTLIPTLSKLT